jgi:carbonic anhydrase
VNNTGASSAGRRDAERVLKDLLAGNERFAEGRPTGPRRSPADYRAVAAAQNPAALILTCSDSRVPPEILFDQGVGDLFVVRVAGNVVVGSGPAVKGSVEFAVADLAVPLIVVLGHSGCGAVKSAITHLEKKDELPGFLRTFVDLLQPALARARERAGDPYEAAIRANVELGVERLRGLEPVLAPRLRDRSLRIVGGVYDLSTARVSIVV